MADTPNETAAPEAGAAQEPKQAAKMQILTQFIKDMSFENIVAQKGVAGDAVPEVNVQVSLDAKKRAAENQYEVTSKYNISSTVKGGDATMFLLELEYTGIFNIENVPAEQMHPFLLIEFPRMLFPFARRIVHDVIRDGGFPPLNLDNVDWVALYRQNLQRQAEAAKAENKSN